MLFLSLCLSPCCGARHLPCRRGGCVICRPLPLAQVAVSATGGAPIAPHHTGRCNLITNTVYTIFSKIARGNSRIFKFRFILQPVRRGGSLTRPQNLVVAMPFREGHCPSPTKWVTDKSEFDGGKPKMFRIGGGCIGRKYLLY